MMVQARSCILYDFRLLTPVVMGCSISAFLPLSVFLFSPPWIWVTGYLPATSPLWKWVCLKPSNLSLSPPPFFLLSKLSSHPFWNTIFCAWGCYAFHLHWRLGRECPGRQHPRRIEGFKHFETTNTDPRLWKCNGCSCLLVCWCVLWWVLHLLCSWLFWKQPSCGRQTQLYGSESPRHTMEVGSRPYSRTRNKCKTRVLEMLLRAIDSGRLGWSGWYHTLQPHWRRSRK